MIRPFRARHSARRNVPRLVHAVLLAVVFVGGCVHSPRVARPARHISYWEALAELYPVEAVAVARTDAERKFAEALTSLMAGDIETAEQGFAALRTTAPDSIIRAGSRVIYTATLQYQEKGSDLAALKNEPAQPKADRTDKEGIEWWAVAFKDVPPKTIAFRTSSTVMPMSV